MTQQPSVPPCAREGCHEPAYTGNALSLASSIGPLIIHLCAAHFAAFLQAALKGTKRESEKEL